MNDLSSDTAYSGPLWMFVILGFVWGCLGWIFYPPVGDFFGILTLVLIILLIIRAMCSRFLDNPTNNTNE